jgi:hypothetical protein
MINRDAKNHTVAQTVPVWAMGAAGLGGIVALFYFGYDQDLLVRVTLGLAAAGLASGLPGLLRFRSRTMSAGGAIGVFVVVLFADPIGRSFSPVNAVPGVSTHVRLSRDQMQFQSEIASAQFEISNKNFDGALEILNHAKRLNPKDPLVLHMIGMLNFNNLGRYTVAANAFEQGYNLGGADKGRFAWNAALSRDAVGETRDAIKWIEAAHKDLSRDDYPTIWDDIVYDRGLLHMIAWLREKGQRRTEDFELAAQSFNMFLDHRPKRPYWADFNLACLHASAAENEAVQGLTRTKAMDHFYKFLREIQGIVDPEKLNYNRAVARRVLALNAPDKTDKRGPLEPVECPAIKNAWDAESGRSWEHDVQKPLGSETATALLKNS